MPPPCRRTRDSVPGPAAARSQWRTEGASLLPARPPQKPPVPVHELPRFSRARRPWLQAPLYLTLDLARVNSVVRLQGLLFSLKSPARRRRRAVRDGCFPRMTSPPAQLPRHGLHLESNRRRPHSQANPLHHKRRRALCKTPTHLLRLCHLPEAQDALQRREAGLQHLQRAWPPMLGLLARPTYQPQRRGQRAVGAP